MNEKSENVGHKTALSLIWKFTERGSVQIIQFVVSIIIARIVDPDAYGVIAILTVFISIATVFVQSGLGSALIQKKDVDDTDFSSVFYYSLILATICYVILFVTSPFIEAFYGTPRLSELLRVMALSLFPGAFNSLQNAVVARNLLFKKQMYSNIIAATASGIIGIILAINNFKEWALVWQQLSYQILICFVLWFYVKWYPSLKFSFNKTKNLLGYGSKILGATLIDTLYHNIASLLIGKKYSNSTLAFYNKGKQFPLIVIDNIDGSIQTVMFPVFSKSQDDRDNLKRMVRSTISISTYIAFPAMTGLAVVANPLINLILGEKWLGCVPYLQLFCLIAVLIPLQTVCLEAYKALGRSDIYFMLILFKRIVGIIILFLCVVLWNNAFTIVIASLVIELFSVFLNIYPNIKILCYTPAEQIGDVIKNLLLSTAMGVITFSVSILFLPLHLSGFIIMILQIFIGVAIFLSLSYLTKNSNFVYIYKYINNIFKRKRNNNV